MFKLEFKRSKKYTERRPTLDAIPARRAQPTNTRPVSPTRPNRPVSPQQQPTPSPAPTQVTTPNAKAESDLVEPQTQVKPTRKRKRIIAIVVILLFIIAMTIYFIQSNIASNQATSPQYATLLPQETSIASLGGWKRVSPPEKDPVFAYTDQVEETAISVSQQPLPGSFKSDIDGNVAQLAKSYSATDSITVNSTKVYIGTSVKGPQSLIFAKNGVLVLIKSEKKIENTAWTQYIASLQSAS